jgi:hypothetical protein
MRLWWKALGSAVDVRIEKMIAFASDGKCEEPVWRRSGPLDLRINVGVQVGRTCGYFDNVIYLSLPCHSMCVASC